MFLIDRNYPLLHLREQLPGNADQAAGFKCRKSARNPTYPIVSVLGSVEVGVDQTRVIDRVPSLVSLALAQERRGLAPGPLRVGGPQAEPEPPEMAPAVMLLVIP